MSIQSKCFHLLLNGQESGLRYFMEQHGEALRFYAYKITRDKEIAEEVVSESFFKLWQNRSKIESLDSIRSFLYLVTKNACFDFLKSAHKKKTIHWDEEILNINSAENDVLTHMVYIELIEQITEELKKLPKQQAAVFEMSYLKGMETEEICKALNTTISNVYYAKSKALSKIRMVFEEKDMGLYFVLLGMFLKL